MPVPGYCLHDLDLIKGLCDGTRYSKDVAEIVGNGCTPKYVQSVMKRYNLPRVPQGAQRGAANPSYKHGRTIDRDGYVLVPAPLGHPHARGIGQILEHRLVMESTLGRYLDPKETVDHMDGLHLHNAPNNLRLFSKNSEHLETTITGQRPVWSITGFAKMKIAPALRKDFERVDIYNQRKKRGEIRLQQILLSLLSLDKDSPYLLGTTRYLEQAQIDYSSQTTIKAALNHLYQQWGWPPAP